MIMYGIVISTILILGIDIRILFNHTNKLYQSPIYTYINPPKGGEVELLSGLLIQHV